MNLDLYPIGWVHTLASLIALSAGAIVPVRPKGTPMHRLRGRIYILAMIASYYLLMGGGVNEAYIRIDALRRLVPDPLNSPLVGMTHFSVMIFFALLIASFNTALLLRRPRPAQ